MDDDLLDVLFKKPPTATSVLKLDAMYYHAALQSFHRAKGALGFERIEAESKELLDKFEGDALKGYSELEPVYIRLTGACERLGFAYAPVVEGLGLTHVLCSAAPESPTTKASSPRRNRKISNVWKTDSRPKRRLSVISFYRLNPDLPSRGS